MLNEIKYHADNLAQILEIEGEEGQFEYLIDYGKKSSCFCPPPLLRIWQESFPPLLGQQPWV